MQTNDTSVTRSVVLTEQKLYCIAGLMPKLNIPFVFASISHFIPVKAITSGHTLKNKIFYFTAKLLVKDNELKTSLPSHTIQSSDKIT